MSHQAGYEYDDLSKRKLRVLIISMGGERQETLRQLFSSSTELQREFEPPVFSPGVSSRSLRSRFECLRIAHQVGLIPEAEWQAIQAAKDDGRYEKVPERFFDCLEGVPVTQGRRGSEADVALHYSVEFWRKAKTLNRGRGVLGCLFAHILALETFTTEGFDILLEDNVRLPIQECATRIRETALASRDWELEHGESSRCHLRLYGWLGSTTNIEYLLTTHKAKRQFSRQNASAVTVMPFPTKEGLDEDLKDMEDSDDSVQDASDREPKSRAPTSESSPPIQQIYFEKSSDNESVCSDVTSPEQRLDQLESESKFLQAKIDQLESESKRQAELDESLKLLQTEFDQVGSELERIQTTRIDQLKCLQQKLPDRAAQNSFYQLKHQVQQELQHLLTKFQCLQQKLSDWSAQKSLRQLKQHQVQQCASKISTDLAKEFAVKFDQLDLGDDGEEHEQNGNDKSSKKHNEPMVQAATSLCAEEEQDAPKTRQHTRPGGNMVWGQYGYWMSREAYESLLEELTMDVGAMMWKGKRMRHFSAKPVDKIIPRRTIDKYGAESVHLSTHPAVFRAPMLTSKIHAQWDPEFCKSTEKQLRYCGLGWKDLCLTDIERRVVAHRESTGNWLTPVQLEQLESKKLMNDE